MHFYVDLEPTPNFSAKLDLWLAVALIVLWRLNIVKFRMAYQVRSLLEKAVVALDADLSSRTFVLDFSIPFLLYCPPRFLLGTHEMLATNPSLARWRYFIGEHPETFSVFQLYDFLQFAKVEIEGVSGDLVSVHSRMLRIGNLLKGLGEILCPTEILGKFSILGVALPFTARPKDLEFCAAAWAGFFRSENITFSVDENEHLVFNVNWDASGITKPDRAVQNRRNLLQNSQGRGYFLVDLTLTASSSFCSAANGHFVAGNVGALAPGEKKDNFEILKSAGITLLSNQELALKAKEITVQALEMARKQQTNPFQYQHPPISAHSKPASTHRKPARHQPPLPPGATHRPGQPLRLKQDPAKLNLKSYNTNRSRNSFQRQKPPRPFPSHPAPDRKQLPTTAPTPPSPTPSPTPQRSSISPLIDFEGLEAQDSKVESACDLDIE